MIKALAFVMILCGAASALEMRHPADYYSPASWPKFTLRVNKATTLRDVFAAGLRPYLTDPQSHVLEFKHANLRLADSGGKLLPSVAVEQAEVRPQPSGLYNLILRSQSSTTAEARAAMTEWLPYIKKTPADLYAFLKEVDLNPVNYDDPKLGKYPDGFAGTWEGRHKEQFSVWFQKSYFREVPLRLTVQVSWHLVRTPAELNTFYEGSIPPPPGYEKESMAQPDDFGPDHVLEMMHAKGIPTLKGMGLTPEMAGVGRPTSKRQPRDQAAPPAPPAAEAAV